MTWITSLRFSWGPISIQIIIVTNWISFLKSAWKNWLELHCRGSAEDQSESRSLDFERRCPSLRHQMMELSIWVALLRQINDEAVFFSCPSVWNQMMKLFSCVALLWDIKWWSYFHALPFCVTSNYKAAIFRCPSMQHQMIELSSSAVIKKFRLLFSLEAPCETSKNGNCLFELHLLKLSFFARSYIWSCHILHCQMMELDLI